MAPPPPIRYEPYQIEGIDVQLFRRKGKKHPQVPEIDPHYEFREELVREVAYTAFPPEGVPAMPLGLAGPKGSGKTSIVTQVAAHCNIPVYRMNLNVGTAVRHLKGQRGAEPGRTVHHAGVVVRAMEEGTWLLLDEVSGATPPVALALFPILEHDGEVLIEDAEPPRYVDRHPEFRVFGTDNVIGASQEATRFNFAGTNPDANEALLDRFGGWVDVRYLPFKREYEMLSRRIPEIEPFVAEGICRAMRAMRTSDINYGFSARMSLNWAQRVTYGYARADGTRETLAGSGAAILDAARVAFLNAMRSPTERDAAAEMIRHLFPDVSEGGMP